MCIKNHQFNCNNKRRIEELTELQALNGAVTDKNVFVFNLAVGLIVESKI